MISLPVLVVAFLIIAAMIFVPILRRVLLLLIRLAIFFAGVAVAAAGIAMLMNNETIFEKPSANQRIARFLTMNSAAASASGSGSVTCDMGDKPKLAVAVETPAVPAAKPTPAPKKHAAKAQADKGAEAVRAAVPIATPAPLNNVYPELIRRGFPASRGRSSFNSRRKRSTLSADGKSSGPTRATSQSIAYTQRESSASKTTSG